MKTEEEFEKWWDGDENAFELQKRQYSFVSRDDALVIWQACQRVNDERVIALESALRALLDAKAIKGQEGYEEARDAAWKQAMEVMGD